MKNIFFLMATILFLDSCRPTENTQDYYKDCQTIENTIDAMANVSSGTDVNFCDLAVDTAKVDSTETTYNLWAVIKSYEFGNNDAHNVKIIVTLPGESKVISFEAITNKGVNLKWRHCKGYITCYSENLSRCTWADSSSTPTVITIKAVTEKPKEKARIVQPSFGIMLYSTSPEANLINNFWFWRSRKLTSNCSVEKINAGSAQSLISSNRSKIEIPCFPMSSHPVDKICKVISPVCDNCLQRNQLCVGLTYTFEAEEDITRIRLIADDGKGNKYHLDAKEIRKGFYELKIEKSFKGSGNSFNQSIDVYRRVGPGCKNHSVRVGML